MKKLIDKLESERALTKDEWFSVLADRDESLSQYLFSRSRNAAQEKFGNGIYVRGLIEISNFCQNNCYYCGIRQGNKDLTRYRLSKEDILACCHQGYNLGYRTFVLQGGEDPGLDDDYLAEIIKEIKEAYPAVAVTLSVGEKSKAVYEKFRSAGTDRYLLRHETYLASHYRKLHPRAMSQSRRLQCLADLRSLGYQVGTGFMVGSPYQTTECLVADMMFIQEFRPEMVGIGPFMPHHKTSFAQSPPGSTELTLYLLALLRLLEPGLLLPATTALNTAVHNGRELGILAGANVIMPNLSPEFACENYELYDNIKYSGLEKAAEMEQIKEDMRKIGYEIKIARGDFR